jgi:hypothetical protein
VVDKMKNKKIIVFFIVGLAIMGVMLYYIGIDEVLEDLKQSNLWFVLLAVVLQFFTYFLFTWRWHIINNAADMSLGIKKLLPMVLVSLAVNNITPSGRGGGEPVRAYLLAKEGNYKFEDTFASVVADRSFDTFPFLILSIITIIGIISTFSLPPTVLAILVICVVGITAAVAILIYLCINEAFGVKITSWIIRLARRFYKSFDENTEKRIVEAVISFQSTMNLLLRNRNILLYALPLSFIIWIFEILRVYAVFLAFGATISPIVIGEVFIIASLVGMVPLLPGGLGAVDGIMILLYSNAGVTASISAAATVVERVISFWMTTFIGLICLMMFGTNVLDRSFSLAESESSKHDELSEEGKRVLEQIDETFEEVSDEDLPTVESEEPVLEIIDEEEKEVLEDEKEVLEEEIKN